MGGDIFGVFYVESVFRKLFFVIGYCGVFGYWLEYSRFLYELVFVMGVDVVEFDVIVMKDGVFVVWYENEILGMMDVVVYLEFVDWKMIKCVDGYVFIGWFMEDFMWVELLMLCGWECLFDVWVLSVSFDGG